MNNRLCLFLLLGSIFPILSKAQGSTTATTRNDSAYIEIVGFGAYDQERLPFWIHTNQWGTVPKEGNGGGFRLGWAGTYNFNNEKKKGLRFTGGIEAVENITKEAQFLLPQAYAGFRLGAFEIFAGRKKQVVGLADSTLGTGQYAVSPNAMPNFRIQFGVFEYTNIPFTKGWLQFLGFYSDGVLDRNRPIVTDLKLHQKQLYFRFGSPQGRVKLYGGFNHNAQWGGKSPYYYDEDNPTDKQMPASFQSYLETIFGVRGPKSSKAHHDSTNRIGNHLGSIDIGMEIKTYGANFLLYRQSVYEDGSLIRLTNIADGLNGIRIRRNNIYGSAIEIHEAVLEFLYTKSQGGPDFDMNDPKKLGRDNYFNNYQVRDGWSYMMRTVGTPFITPGVDTQQLGQGYLYGDSFTNNNRVWAFHLGMKGGIANKLIWTTKLSYSRNFGVYDLENSWPEKGLGQFSGLLSLSRRTNWLGGLTIGANLAMDYGDLYPVTYGGMLSLKKHIYF